MMNFILKRNPIYCMCLLGVILKWWDVWGCLTLQKNFVDVKEWLALKRPCKKLRKYFLNKTQTPEKIPRTHSSSLLDASHGINWHCFKRKQKQNENAEHVRMFMNSWWQICFRLFKIILTSPSECYLYFSSSSLNPFSVWNAFLFKFWIMT